MRLTMLLALAVLSCASAQTNPSPLPASADGGVCVGYCAALTKYSCPGAVTVDGGDSCFTVCNRTLSGTFDLNPACVADAGSAAQVVACGTPCAAVTDAGDATVR